MTRYIFLMILFFGAISIDSLVHGKQPHKKVLILGAGLSGIVAGKTLHDNGIDDFLILEGQDYIGGRIKKASFSGFTVEQGANWIHSAKDEDSAPIWELKEKEKLKGIKSNHESIVMRSENGTVLNEDANWKLLGKAMMAVTKEQEKREEENKPPISVRAALSGLGWTPKTPAQYSMDYFTFDFEHAKKPELTSFSSIDGWSGEGEGYEFFCTDQRGLFSIYESIKKSVQSRTKLNTTVTDIKYNESTVEVTTQNGEIYTADFVLCTFSTGVLASDMVKFSPPLPQWKKDSILKMPMSVYTKIFLKFPKKFWDNKEYILLAAQKRGFYPVFQDLERQGISPEGSGLLLITVTGEEGRRIENQTFEKTKQEIVKMLRGVYGQSVPEPTDIYYARWSKNLYTRGSYCDGTVDFTDKDITNLGKNVDVLHFSGAATRLEWYGTMQGAYLSGAQRAKDIAKAIKSRASLKLRSKYYLVFVAPVLAWMIMQNV